MGRDYQKICDFQNLYASHMKCRRRKGHKSEVLAYEMDLAHNISNLSGELMVKEYRMKNYYHFTITQPKTRQIYATHYQDRIVIRTLCDHVISKIIGPRLIHANTACQKNKGTHFSLDLMTKYLRQHYKQYGNQGYALKCDIHHYFASINHKVLKGKLEKVIKDKEVLDLIFHYIDRFETTKGSGAGIPLGNQSSQWYGVYYMDTLDRKMKEEFAIKHYIRYMDDFILIHHDKQYLRECLHFIKTYVEDELRMELNNKTQIYQLKKGFEFLGWNFYLTDSGRVVKKIRTQSKLRAKRRFKQVAAEYREEKCDLAHVKQVTMSYKGHLKHGDTFVLRKNLFRQLYTDLYLEH